ncbi:hypothetical protein PR202_gb05120 [Eleusine coracana subsp. coracana]|uniref:Uncharacterized protein n=1 Tax=Eleusine coracana subsp. coracana TaxID=191504 RepID=A0AAV5E4N3_ELECO|nr:hypothetical protein PR202_gb05120 [Eleusine coracana subsp. coracana]
MMSPSPLQRLLLLLLAAAASAVSPAGGGCSTGCDVAVAYYSTKPNQNLTYIGSLFGIEDYRALAAYNAGHPNQDFVPAGEPVLVNFTCRCLALPGAPSSTYLAGSFPYRVSPGDTYSSIAAVYNNLTTAAWLEETNCSCGDPAVSPDLRMFLTYPLGEGETLVSSEQNSASAGISGLFGLCIILLAFFLSTFHEQGPQDVGKQDHGLAIATEVILS